MGEYNWWDITIEGLKPTPEAKRLREKAKRGIELTPEEEKYLNHPVYKICPD